MNLGIAYESSDEEDVTPVVEPQKPISKGSSVTGPPKGDPVPIIEHAQGPINGPAMGPTAPPPPTIAGPLEDGGPDSPYTSARSMIRNLTLPTVPNFDIPPSPPGSPPERATKKFAQFLDLKQKGQHFNQRLESSSVLRDPGHLQRLMEFASIGEEEQYASTLPEDVAVPTTFPEWAYVEELTASQKRIAKSLPRDAIEFVPAAKSGTSSGTGTPSAKGARQSAVERVMAGVDRPQSGKRKELEQRGGREESSSRKWSSRSRSPKRRRSTSRDRR